jgi:hypothetical protein
MHHKHKRTPAKENKRYGHKSARARANIAINGGHPGQARGMSWSNSIPQPPIVDEVGKHKKMAAKSPPKKERCPINGTHEWYREWTVETKIHTDAKQGYWKCDACNRLREELGWYPRTYCPAHIIVTPYEVHTRTDTCIHCWVEKKRVSQPSVWTLNRRPRPYKPRTAYRRK